MLQGSITNTHQSSADLFLTGKSTLKDCLLIFALSLFIYLPFLGLIGFDGNEPVRVIVAENMLKTGNWLIPFLHGKPYFLKPPLMSWLIAAGGSLFGTVNEWISRLPSVIAALLTGITIYFLTRDWLGREGRLFAAIATISMVGLIAKGRTAEIDSLFIFFVVLILLIWLKGYVRGWKPSVLWSVSLTILGIGFLAKGPQIIGYFYVTVFAYLLYRKKLSFFFSKFHLLGILCFVLILGGYLLTVLQWIPFDDYIKMWKGQIAQRAYSKSYSFIGHVLSYPPRILLEFMPWSLFVLPVIIFRTMRLKAGEVLRNEIVIFSLVLIVVNFPLYWMLPGSRVRYFLPAGPFFAIIMAALFESYQNAEIPEITLFFRWFLKFLSWAALVGVFMIPLLIIYMKLRLNLSVITLIAGLIFFSFFIIYKASTIQLGRIPALFALMMGFIFLLYTDLHIQDDTQKDDYPRKMAYEINRLLPDNTDTVYELGYDRFLEITCYLKKDIVQLDNFIQLKSLENKKNVYFIFDEKFLEHRTSDEKNIFQKEIRWEKVYSKNYGKEKGQIIVGHLI